MVDLQKKKKEEKEEARRKFTLDLRNQKESSFPPPAKEVSETKNLPENIEAASKEAFKETKQQPKEPSIDEVVPSKQEKPETGSMSDGLKDALMYLGPRLGGLLIGGYEGYQEADKLATGFQKYQAGKKETGSFQQTAFVTKQGTPVQAKKGVYYDMEGNKMDPSNIMTKYEYDITQAERIRNPRRERGFTLKERKAYQQEKKQFTGRKDIAKYRENQVTLEGIKTLLTDGQALQDASLSLVARSISREVGVLTDNDIKRAQINPSVIDRVRRGYYRNIKGVIAPRDRDALLKLVNVIQDQETRIAEKKAISFADSVTRNLNEEDKKYYLKDILREGGIDIKKSQPQQPQEENSRVASALDKIKRAKEGKR